MYEIRIADRVLSRHRSVARADKALWAAQQANPSTLVVQHHTRTGVTVTSSMLADTSRPQNPFWRYQ